MAVNGIEIKVGQVWRTRGGGEVEITGSAEGFPFQWRLRNGDTVTDEGHMFAQPDSRDIVELIRDEHGFTIWRGGEQPEETKGKDVQVVFRGIELSNQAGPADRLRWTYVDNAADIVAYKIVKERVVGMSPAHAAPYGKPDPDALAAETLESLGWRFDGQTWVQEPKAEPELQIEMFEPQRALDVQVGGEHYKSLAIQPIEYIHANNIPFAEGSVIKYVTRWRTKNGIKDLEKARHFLDLLIELEAKAKEGGAA